MHRSVDVFVVGGGPAGLVAAIAARRKGFSVAVADGADYPIDKPCGEGLLPETQSLLAELDVQIPEGASYRFKGIRFLQRDSQVCADNPRGPGLGIRRTVLHELLVEKARACGVHLLWKTPVLGIDADGVILNHGHLPSRWIIGADGTSSRVRRWSDLDASATRSSRFARRRHYRLTPWTDYMEIYWSERSQIYVTPISADEICIVALADQAEDASFTRSLADWPELQQRLANAPISSRERGAITSMHSLRRVTRENVALVGDASGSVDAITGEGLRLAFREGLLLADALQSGNLKSYQLAHRKLLLRPTWMGKLMLSLGRGEKFRRRAIHSLAEKPELFAQIVAIHLGQSSPGHLLATGARLGWQFLAA